MRCSCLPYNRISTARKVDGFRGPVVGNKQFCRWVIFMAGFFLKSPNAMLASWACVNAVRTTGCSSPRGTVGGGGCVVDCRASEPCCVGPTSAEGDGRVAGPSAASATAARDMYASPLSADVAAACVPHVWLLKMVTHQHFCGGGATSFLFSRRLMTATFMSGCLYCRGLLFLASSFL